jgi:Holliday junction resolvase
VSAASKAKGSLFERQVEEYLNESGMHARRLPRAGNKDIGDVALELRTKRVLVLEAKNRKSADMAEWLREAAIEADNYEVKYAAVTYPVVVTKTRQKGAGEARVTMTLDTLINLLKWEGLA